MRRQVSFIALLGLLAGCTGASRSVRYLSPEQVCASGGFVYATAATAARVFRVAGDGSSPVSWQIRDPRNGAPRNPTGVACGGNRVFVSAGTVDGGVFRYREDGSSDGFLMLGHSPCAPVVSPDGRRVYAASRFGGEVFEIDAVQMKVLRSSRAAREPVALALGSGGRLLFAACFLPAMAATDGVVAAEVDVFDLADRSMAARRILLPDGSTAVRGICASPDGKRVYAVHSLSRYQLPTTQLERGWMNTAAISVFNGESGEYLATVLLDEIALGAANPWGVAADAGTIAVSHAGTRELSIIDRTAFDAKIDLAVAEGRVAEAAGDFDFLRGIRRRIVLSCDGPRGVALADGTAVAALYFGDALAFVGPDGEKREVHLGPVPDIAGDPVRRGEILYNDATACFQHWQSCASCHPDARADGLNWDLLNDGIGNPKQTKSELYSHLTPPTMATGIRANSHACNGAGFLHIQFSLRSEEQIACVDAYCASLRPVPSPRLDAKGRLSAAAKRGKVVFWKAGCARCHDESVRGAHGEPLWTDLMAYEVGTGTGLEAGRKFDTPSLVECWRTAPYLYDGRSRTMKDLLTRDNPGDCHGKTSNLSDAEIDDLAEFVLSL